MTAIAADEVYRPVSVRHRVPPRRVVQVELRKMFDTRSGFWLMVSFAIAAMVLTFAVGALGKLLSTALTGSAGVGRDADPVPLLRPGHGAEPAHRIRVAAHPLTIGLVLVMRPEVK